MHSVEFVFGLVQPPSRCLTDFGISVVTCNYWFAAREGRTTTFGGLTGMSLLLLLFPSSCIRASPPPEEKQKLSRGMPQVEWGAYVMSGNVTLMCVSAALDVVQLTGRQQFVFFGKRLE